MRWIGYILLSFTHNRLSPSSIDTQDLGYEREMSLRYSSNTLHCFLKDKVDNFSVDTLYIEANGQEQSQKYNGNASEELADNETPGR